MNPSTHESVPWSRRRWTWTILALLAGQFAFIMVLANRKKAEPRKPEPRAILTLQGETGDSQLASAVLAWNDPSLFAIGNSHNFSGAAWINPLPFRHRLRDWSESNHWLRQDQGVLGKLFTPSKDIAAQPLLAAQKPSPRLTELLIGNEPAATQSVLRVEGELAGRPLDYAPALPSWPRTDALSDSVVDIKVNAAGAPLSATLWASSGLLAADQQALRLAKAIRFKPTGNGAAGLSNVVSYVTWGQLVFSWHTTNPAQTNQQQAAR